MINNLKEIEYYILSGDSKIVKIDMIVFFCFYFFDKRDNMYVIRDGVDYF